MKQRLAIIGSGDLGALIAYHAVNDHQYTVAGCFDDFAAAGSVKNGMQVWGGLESVEPRFKAGDYDCLMMGIGYLHMQARKAIFERFRGTIPFGNVIHSSSYVDASVRMGEGIFILPGCTLDMQVELDDNVLLNTGVTIAHDTRVGAHSFLGPAVCVAGKTHIGSCCFVGINSTIIDNITIADGARIAGGAVVTKHLTSPGLYAGVPAQLKRPVE